MSAETAIGVLSERLREVRARLDELRETEKYIEDNIALYEKQASANG